MASPLELLLLIAVGRILIYLWSEFPLPEWVDKVSSESYTIVPNVPERGFTQPYLFYLGWTF